MIREKLFKNISGNFPLGPSRQRSITESISAGVLEVGSTQLLCVSWGLRANTPPLQLTVGSTPSTPVISRVTLQWSAVSGAEKQNWVSWDGFYAIFLDRLCLDRTNMSPVVRSVMVLVMLMVLCCDLKVINVLWVVCWDLSNQCVMSVTPC